MNAHSKPVRVVTADASKVSGADFARSLGLRIRTPAEKLAEWNDRVEYYVERILAGCQFSEYGNPQVAEAMKRIALREGDAAATGDPMKRNAA